MAAVCLAACSQADKPAGAPASVSPALSLPTGSPIEYVDYTFQLVFLETNPPTTYFTKTVHQVGETPVPAVFPCTTIGEQGKNQLFVTAKIKFKDSDTIYEATSSPTFNCVRNADTPVTVLLTIYRTRDAGFFDTAFIVNGTSCATKTDLKTDNWNGTCSSSSCGREDQDIDWKPDSEGVFLFANGCQTVQAKTPTFFVCGDYGAEWVVDGEAAHAFFPIPSGDPSLRDKTWHFGVVALDRFKLVPKDPVLTDDAGLVTVWGKVGFSRATFTLVGGMALGKPAPPTVDYHDFAAIVTAPPLVAGDPSTDLLVLVQNVPESRSARVRFFRKRGLCDREPLGIKEYPLTVVEVKRSGNSGIRLTLSAGSGTGTALIATATADCTASTSFDGNEPMITCTGVTPITP